MLIGTLKRGRTAETVVNFGVTESSQGLIGYISRHEYHVHRYDRTAPNAGPSRDRNVKYIRDVRAALFLTT